ncbi:hypothetical protein Niako_6409 [Niastella koreensis GR20-10]|uniref:Uncharacterized protein n=1 Tax=Niastella koreensis (strain DSM 17620 / KACC 11465 / NBRC 106392 / GR20-10) TaxID=700598 RepID=G8TDZ9_NIAKG|nr:hypothetical protein Niako_6409 [Niastella koreensis GR20-10]
MLSIFRLGRNYTLTKNPIKSQGVAEGQLYKK